MPDGSKTNSSSRSDRRDSQRNMAPGKTLTVSIMVRDHACWRKEMRTLTLRRTSIANIQMCPEVLTL